MNEQLRKAILDAATLEEIVIQDNVHGTIHTDFYRRQAVDASQAKLLRVIEILVQQRESWIKLHFCDDHAAAFQIATAMGKDDAELIAALEKPE